MKFRFIGCGDAFGSGGRLNTCFHVVGAKVDFLIDLGASSLIGMKAQGVDRNAIRAIFVTHFHADHFGGLPFFMLDAQFFSRRTQPLVIVGPVGLQDWGRRVMETGYPGSSSTPLRFDLQWVELAAGQRATVADVEVQAYQAVHGSPGGPFLMYRLLAEGRSIAYTGDTAWTDDLLLAGREVDLLVAEAYFHDKKVPLHLDFASLHRQLPRMRPRRLVVTHMSEDMLSRLEQLPCEAAHDGLVLEL